MTTYIGTEPDLVNGPVQVATSTADVDRAILPEVQVSTGAEVRVVAADLMVVVTVSPGRDGDSRDLEYLVNYSEWPIKDWLTKTTVWALTNNRSVSMRAADQHDLDSRRRFWPRNIGGSTDDTMLDTRRGDDWD